MYAILADVRRLPYRWNLFSFASAAAGPTLRVRKAASVLTLVLLASCSGSGSSAPQHLPASVGPLSSGVVSLTIANGPASSSKERRPAFVSPSASSVGLSVNGSAPAYSDISSTSTACVPVSGGRTCTVPVMAPAGSDTFAITIYDGASGSGTVLGGGTGSTTVTNGQPFTVTIAVNPVVASLTSPVFVFSSGSSFTVGTAGTASLTFTALDPDHNSIAPSSTSAFASPVQLVSSDPHVAVSPASWTSPTQPITLTYDGSTAVGTTVTVSAKIASVSIGSATTSTAFAYVVSTFAGTGAAGSTNGTNLSATFNGPVGLTLDTSGNLIVSERSGDDVRKISGGIVSTVSGTGALGSLDGPALTATYNIPNALAFDAVGNLYVADIYNDKIRKLSTAGIVTTYAGTGAPGAMNGAAASATFFQPQGLAIDAGGDLFIADLGNNAIREISAAGIVSTFAGSGAVGSMDGPAATATFNMPSGIAVDSAGTVYVTDTSNHKIRKIAGGVVSTLAGTGATSPVVNGPGATATFFHPQGIAVDAAGDLLVSDQFNNLIRKITPAGVVSTVAGTGSAGSMDGPGFSATLNQPTGIVVSPSGMIYVADYANNKIRVITP